MDSEKVVIVDEKAANLKSFLDDIPSKFRERVKDADVASKTRSCISTILEEIGALKTCLNEYYDIEDGIKTSLQKRDSKMLGVGWTVYNFKGPNSPSFIRYRLRTKLHYLEEQCKLLSEDTSNLKEILKQKGRWLELFQKDLEKFINNCT